MEDLQDKIKDFDQEAFKTTCKEQLEEIKTSITNFDFSESIQIIEEKFKALNERVANLKVVIEEHQTETMPPLALADELWISNLMLANNLCDAQEDEDNHRTTIIHFIGKKGGLIAFSVKNVLAFLVIFLLPFLGIAPKTVWLTVIIVPFVYKQNKILIGKQVKTETFITGVKTLLVGSLTYLVTYFLGILF